VVDQPWECLVFASGLHLHAATTDSQAEIFPHKVQR